MDIKTRQTKGVTILDLEGKLTIGTGDVRLRGALLDELEENHTQILVNLQNVKTIDSSGLGELIRCKATVAARGGEIKLLNANLKARKLLTMAQLVGVFEMFEIFWLVSRNCIAPLPVYLQLPNSVPTGSLI